jgi:hypothetical protein
VGAEREGADLHTGAAQGAVLHLVGRPDSGIIDKRNSVPERYGTLFRLAGSVVQGAAR